MEILRRFCFSGSAAALAVICLIGLFLRLGFFVQVRDDPFFRIPTVDTKEYVNWTKEIHRGQILWDSIPNHVPVYPFYLRLFYGWGGLNVDGVILSQYLMGLLNIVLVFRISRLILPSVLPAAVAAAMAAVFWQFIYFESRVLSETLAATLNLAGMYILLRADQSGARRLYFLGGLILGLSAMTRANPVMFIGFAAIYFVYQGIRSGTGSAMAGRAILFVTGAMLVAAPVLARNYVLSGSLLLQGKTGVDFYLGNTPTWNGTSHQLQVGREWDDLLEPPYQEEGIRDEAAINWYFMKKSWDFIRSNPGGWARIMIRKTYLFWSGEDLLRSEDVHFLNEHIRRFKGFILSAPFLYSCIMAGLLVSPAVPGNFRLLYLFVLSNFVSTVLFHIKTRYFIPALPVMIVFAGVYAEFIRTRMKSYASAAAAIFLGLLLYGLTGFVRPVQVTLPDESEGYYSLGTTLAQQNHPDAATYLLRAIEIRPEYYEAHNNLGMFYIQIGDYAAADTCLRRALALRPDARVAAENYRRLKSLVKRD